ncbi:SPOR domain-containing protein [Saccharicrinis sp. FJH54]|uniref:HU domain-containing protein n=1 Tax=Saccharicrinis sp. FJH54 TaxID=3344665 RepID=UPI0035D4BE86
MQNLAGYIKDLLLVHDCVIIPQFGGFVSSYKPACFDAALKRFFPPSKEITFNSKLTHNDGLLCQQIMKHEKKSFADSVDRIQSAVENAEQWLDNDVLVLSGLGILSRREDGILLFEPEQENRLLKSAYGLASFSMNEIEQQERGADMKLVKKNKPQSGRSISHFAAAVAALFLLFFFLFPAKVKDPRLETADFTSMFDSLNKSVTDIPAKEHAVSQNDLTPDMDQTAQHHGSETDEFASANVPEDSEIEPAASEDQNEDQTSNPVTDKVKMVPSVTYHIIIASLISKEQALEFVEQNCKKYFPDYSIIESNGRFRVSIGTFTSKKDAVPVLETFREKNPKFKDAWLLTIKATV